MAGRIGLATAGSILPAGWGGLAAGPAVGASGDAAEVEAQDASGAGGGGGGEERIEMKTRDGEGTA